MTEQHLLDTIAQYNQMGRDFIYKGIKYICDKTYVRSKAACMIADMSVCGPVQILPGTTLIVSEGFRGANISAVDIPDSVNIIQDYAFEACHGLEYVRLGSGIYDMQNGAFCFCSHLKEADMRRCHDLIEIPAFAFQQCMSLRRVYLPAGLSRIQDHAFAWDDSLKEVYMPSHISHISQNAFHRSSEASVKRSRRYYYDKLGRDAPFTADMPDFAHTKIIPQSDTSELTWYIFPLVGLKQEHCLRISTASGIDVSDMKKYYYALELRVRHLELSAYDRKTKTRILSIGLQGIVSSEEYTELWRAVSAWFEEYRNKRHG